MAETEWSPHDAAKMIKGRPDLYGNPRFDVFRRATRFPPYVFATSKNAALVHKVAGVKFRHWVLDHGGHNLLYTAKPPAIAETVCNCSFFLEAKRTRTCVVPKPDAILCGACHGDVRPFGKHGWARAVGLTRAEANVKLGCIVNGY